MSTEQSQDSAETEALHKFWGGQPIVHNDDTRDEFDCYIDQSIPVTEPSKSPGFLPKGFKWCEIDISDDKVMDEIYSFLSKNYVEDNQHSFRFLMSKDLLRWAIDTPGVERDWIFGVRSPNNLLVGFIAGIRTDIRLNGKVEPWAAVNYLCVHSRLRQKSLAPVLISELVRRVRLHHVYKAVFSGQGLPSKPFSKAFYRHRPINLKKLSHVGFYPIEQSRMAQAQKRYAVPKLVHNNIVK